MRRVVRILLPVALLLIAFWIYSIVDCALLPPTRHRGVSKPVWLLIVVLFPVIGGILWLVVGHGRAREATVPRAPDDDPVFLGSIGSTGSFGDQDERIRRLEAELAALDAEEADPDPPPRPTPGAPGAAPDDDADSRGTRG